MRAEHDNLAQALRYGLARADAGTVAATSAALGALWIIDSNYPRLMAMASETAYLLSHFRPGPDLLEVTRTALTLYTTYTFLLEGLARCAPWLPPPAAPGPAGHPDSCRRGRAWHHARGSLGPVRAV